MSAVSIRTIKRELMAGAGDGVRGGGGGGRQPLIVPPVSGVMSGRRLMAAVLQSFKSSCIMQVRTDNCAQCDGRKASSSGSVKPRSWSLIKVVTFNKTLICNRLDGINGNLITPTGTVTSGRHVASDNGSVIRRQMIK